MQAALTRSRDFCARFGLRVPILLAPMAGVPAPDLSAAVMHAGGLGACGGLLMGPSEISHWSSQARAAGGPAFQLNLWIPGQPAARDAVHEAKVRAFLSEWGPPVPPTAADAVPPDFEAQFDAVCDAAPRVASSVMGLYSPPMVRRLKERHIAWFANVSTVAEARAAESAGADAVVVQGAEAGGHRGCFPTTHAELQAVGLFSLLPAVADAVRIPVVGTGGIADARGIAAALALGASAVQVGTGFLRCPEAGISPAWAAALAELQPEDTAVTRAFTGKPGRAIFTEYVRAAGADTAPSPAPYPVQRGLTAAMRAHGQATGNVQLMQAWAGQSARLARAIPACALTTSLWEGALEAMGTPAAWAQR